MLSGGNGFCRGLYRVLDVGADSLTLKVTLNPGHGVNYHSHERRAEVWT